MNDIVHPQRSSGSQEGSNRTNIQYLSKLEKFLTIHIGRANKDRDLKTQARLTALLDNRIHQDPPSRNNSLHGHHRYLGNSTVTTPLVTVQVQYRVLACGKCLEVSNMISDVYEIRHTCEPIVP